jgi:hypothetical protein
MSLKAGTTRDSFTFSLGGLTTIASFVPAPVVADNRIRQQRSERSGGSRHQCDCGSHRQEADCPSAA